MRRAVVSAQHVLHLFIISTRGGSSSVFLVENQPGMLEFPRICVPAAVLDDESALVAKVRAATGIDVAISGFLATQAGETIDPPDSRFLICRAIGGTPRPAAAHTGWEWRTGNNLFTLQFLPKVMVDELRVFMNG
jgi:hypothetical protein